MPDGNAEKGVLKVAQPSIKTVWGIAKSPELRLTDEELHLVVAAHTGKESIKELNKRELCRVISVLGNMKESARKAEGSRSHRGGNPATENQRKKIYKLAQSLGWDKPARLNGFCKKMFHVSSVEWLDYRQCSKLIEALKSMGQRQDDKGGVITDGKAQETYKQGKEAQCGGKEAVTGAGHASAGQAKAEPEEVH